MRRLASSDLLSNPRGSAGYGQKHLPWRLGYIVAWFERYLMPQPGDYGSKARGMAH